MIAWSRVPSKLFLLSAVILEGLLLMLVLREPLSVGASTVSSPRYVSTTGNDSANDCSNSVAPCRTVQHAVDQSNSNDEILVSTGVYTGVQARAGMTQVVYISKTVALLGGYNSDFSSRDPAAYPTTLDAQRQGRVISIVGAAAAPRLQGFTITGGYAHGLTDLCPSANGPTQGCGGGILVHAAHPTISGNIISNNVAATSVGSSAASGGGLCMSYSHGAVITGNLIISNVASLGARGLGGGVHLSYGYQVLVSANQVLSNVATLHDTLSGWGGGIAVGGSGSSPIIHDNWLAGNRTNGTGTGIGAAFYHWYGACDFVGNRVLSNQGAHAVYLGACANGARIASNLVYDNNTGTGVQLTNGANGKVTLSNNVVARSGGWALSARASSSAPLVASLLHNTLVGPGTGYGLNVETAYVTLSLTNTLIASHTWGITNSVPLSSTVDPEHTLFWANDHVGIQGSNPLFGDPAFKMPAAGDYHLRSGSAARDAGLEAGESLDMDGQLRPFGPAPDIGADEFWLWHVYLPQVLRQY